MSSICAISQRLQGYPAAIASAALLGFTGILMRILSLDYQMPALVMAFWRSMLVVAVLVPVLMIWKPIWLRLNPPQLVYYAFYGLLMAIFNLLWTLSVALNGAAISTILVYSSVPFTLICGWLFYAERSGWPEILLVMLSLCGCLLVCGGGDLASAHWSLGGLVIGLLSGLGYGCYTLGGRIATRRHYPVWNTILYVFAFAAGYQFLLNALVWQSALIHSDWALIRQSVGSVWYLSEQTQQPVWLGWMWLILLAAGPTLLGFGLYNQSLKYLPMGIANLIVSLEVVFTALIAYVWLGERLAGWQWAGGLLVLLSIIGLHTCSRRRQAGAAAV